MSPFSGVASLIYTDWRDIGGREGGCSSRQA